MLNFYQVFFFYLTVFFTPSLAFATERPKELQAVGITEHLGAQLQFEGLEFQSDLGEAVLLSRYFEKKQPVLLALIYLKCPSLCNLILKGLLESLRVLDLSTGKDFQLVALSIDPSETPKLALAKKENYLRIYQRPGTESGWHFLTGKEPQIRGLADQLGFEYQYVEKEKQYAHPAVLFVLTPQGKISRYLYGASFPVQNLKLSLLEASSGKIGTVMDRILLFCFHFDPDKNSYTLKMWRFAQVIICLQVTIGGAFLYRLWRKEYKLS